MDNQITLAPTRRPGGGRDDCWSEAATETLIEAWGERYVHLNRGNLRQKDWRQVADAVNVHRTGIKPPRTDIQCKNRIDTLKKKYKVEKLKAAPSKWPFFYRLEELIGPSSMSVGTKKSKRSSVLAKAKAKEMVGYSINTRMRMEDSSGSDESEEFGGGREEVEEEDDVAFSGGRKARMDYVDFTEESAYKELARAILRFGEIYERIESSKQQQMMELEKQRMEFTKDLEVQRMNMFMDTQLELEKMKRIGNDRSNGGEILGLLISYLLI
ncbi:hypothetical protein DCAR_0313360 [Daucus carota subsp. sativus]|uniref:Myb/SANT-like DNA-binding domain-containing protein n=1 Tax=Daucus carota subsp. sativus TaxID=79200 RepID=A0A161WWI7_DAUCS|nr:hypothetical protein DCAR_0313360 [Daucus carota subsp. sativus]